MAPFGFRGYNGGVKGVAALAVALAAIFVATAAAAPRPHVERVRSGDVQAVFSYTYDATKFRFGRQRLSITRLGVMRLAALLRHPPRGGFDARAQGEGVLPATVPGISIDSRTLVLGEAFFAITGDARDGHEFVGQAFGHEVGDRGPLREDSGRYRHPGRGCRRRRVHGGSRNSPAKENRAACQI